jgi:hypothetical protein
MEDIRSRALQVEELVCVHWPSQACQLYETNRETRTHHPRNVDDFEQFNTAMGASFPTVDGARERAIRDHTTQHRLVAEDKLLASVSSGVAVPGLFRGVPGGSSGVSRGLFRGVPGPFQDTNIYLVCILLPWAIFFGGGQARREGVWAA